MDESYIFCNLTDNLNQPQGVVFFTQFLVFFRGLTRYNKYFDTGLLLISINCVSCKSKHYEICSIFKIITIPSNENMFRLQLLYKGLSSFTFTDSSDAAFSFMQDIKFCDFYRLQDHEVKEMLKSVGMSPIIMFPRVKEYYNGYECGEESFFLNMYKKVQNNKINLKKYNEKKNRPIVFSPLPSFKNIL